MIRKFSISLPKQKKIQKESQTETSPLHAILSLAELQRLSKSLADLHT
jgi:hypothetical protein